MNKAISLPKLFVSIIVLVCLVCSACAEYDFSQMSDSELEGIIAEASDELNKRKQSSTETVENSGPVIIEEAAFIQWGGNRVEYVFVAKSNISDKAIYRPNFKVIINDSDGIPIDTKTEEVNCYLLPGQTIAVASSYPMDVGDETPVSIEVEFIDPDALYFSKYVDVDKVNNPGAIPLVVDSAKVRKKGNDTEVLGNIFNPNSYDIEKAGVTVVFRDVNGKLVGGGDSIIESLKAGEKTAFKIWRIFGITDNFEVYCYIKD